MTPTYFALDGNYGYAHALVVIDTVMWTEEDWIAIDNASDNDRIAVAVEIARKYS